MKDNTLYLEGELVFSKAKETLDSVMSMLDDPEKNILDLSGVSEIDSTGLQVIMLLLLEANKLDRKISLTSLSVVVENLFKRLNIEILIDNQENITLQ